MRIIAGTRKGRKITAPSGMVTRPTTDRLRETLFNILIHRFEIEFSSMICLDLFAGTGGLGLEALSRGAKFCTFVENNAAAYKALQHNIHELEFQNQAQRLKTDATRLKTLYDKNANLIFCDPPYGKGFAEKALTNAVENQLLTENALIIIEESKNTDLHLPEAFEVIEHREISDTQFLFINLNTLK